MAGPGWVLAYPLIWLETYRLKRRHRLEGWSDGRYYEAMFSLARLMPDIEGDKFAGLREAVSAQLPPDPNARILELGCGAGYQARHMWSEGRHDICACDLVVTRVRTALQRSRETCIRYIACDMEALAFPRGTFDAAVISVALHDIHPSRVSAVIDECGRMIAAGGRLIILEPRQRRDQPLAFLRRIYPAVADLLDESLNIRAFVDLDVEAMASEAGFALLAKRMLWAGILCLYTFVKAPQSTLA